MRFPHRIGRWLGHFAVFAAIGTAGIGTVPIQAAEHQPLGVISLTDVTGKTSTLAEHHEESLLVVVFLGTECPLARLYGTRLAKLASDFAPRGVRFVGVNSNCQDSLVEIGAYARRHQLDFPILKDVGNVLADALGAVRTPEVFVLDGGWDVRYRGRIDDQYGVGYIRDEPTRHDLRLALRSIIEDRSVEQPETESVGCYIGRIPKATGDESVTYGREISRIFQQHCIECHRDGEIAPFSLTEYDEVVGWAETVSEVIREGRMPPWHANPQYGEFRNQRLMTDEEKQLVYRWVNNGAPRGNADDLPPTRRFVSGWQLPREPDLVVSMRDRPFPVAAEGVIEYQHFVVDPGFKEDKWITAAEVVPGNREVVHHCIVFVRPPDKVGLRGYGWLAAYVPGQVPIALPTGCGRRVPAGSRLVFQMHYTPNGTPQEDVTRVGMLFADPAEIDQETITLVAINRQFRIPPGAADYEVEASVGWIPESGRLLALAPHMHLRGRAFRFVANRGSTRQILLDVPHYDFNWQHVYQLAEPMPLTGNIQIEAQARFDNSEDNLVNPDPAATVRWGDQSWQEMMVGFLDVAVPKGAKLKLPWEDGPGDQADSKSRRRKAAEEFVAKFDNNGDARIERNEVPTEFAIFAFSRFDRNSDDVITLEEAIFRAAD